MSDEEYEIIFVPNEGRAVLDKKTKKIYYSEFQIIEEKNEQLDKYKEVLDKIKEYITTIDTYYAIGCWNKDEEFVDVKKDILELLEEIE